MISFISGGSNSSGRSKGSILFGLFLVWAGMTALWKNEVRFDLEQAASDAVYTASPTTTIPGENFSHTGRIDPIPVVDDLYVGSLSGYLVVERYAEIYAWDRESQSDGPDRWTLEWQSRPESNARNNGLQQRLTGGRLLPHAYQLGQLEISADEIRFVDDKQTLSPRSLNWQDQRLTPTRSTGEYFYFSVSGGQGNNTELGDERLSYRVIPVPPQLTYFGKYDGRSAVVDDSGRREGMINQIIQNEGLLHHLVAGDRATAIESIADNQAMIKLYVRLGGTVAVILGLQCLLAKVFALLLMIPGIGYVVERALSLVSFGLGLVLSLTTMGLGLIAANPLILVALCGAIVAGFVLLRKRAANQTAVAHAAVSTQYESQLQDHSLSEIEFIELARLAALDGDIGAEERKMLFEWARDRGWSEIVADALIEKALRDDTGFLPEASRPDMVANLVRIALADGTLSARELDRIKAISRRAGLRDTAVHNLIKQVQSEVAPHHA